MAAPEIDIKYVAHLARLALTPAEEKKLGVTGVQPTAHDVPMVNATRADEIRPSLPHEDALRNAPAKANGLFMVPKIVE